MTNGYRVHMTPYLGKARDFLEKEDIHLMIVTPHLINDHDKRDMSGIKFAQSLEPSLPKLILSQSWEETTMRLALGQNLEDISTMVDFVSRTEGPETLLRTVEEMFLRFPPTEITSRERMEGKLLTAA